MEHGSLGQGHGHLRSQCEHELSFIFQLSPKPVENGNPLCLSGGENQWNS
jgi:hypothetical protein